MQQILNIVRHAALATLLGVISYGAKAECLVRSASAIVKDREVGPVTNLIRAKYRKSSSGITLYRLKTLSASLDG
jgi:hypothetical protein